MSENVKINRGLKGIYFERSAVSHIDGSAGTLSYRGYSIDALATQSTFEEVSYLLIYGDLPTQAELADFDAKLKDARELPASVYDVIRATKDGHPMDVLRTATSALAALTPTSQDVSVEAFIENGIKLTSQVPMIIAAHDRIRNGLDPVAADKTLSHAANWLWMLKGEKPSEDAARLGRCGLYPTRRTRIKRIQLCRTCYNRNRGEFAWRHRDGPVDTGGSCAWWCGRGRDENGA